MNNPQKKWAPVHLISHDLSLNKQNILKATENYNTPFYIYDLDWIIQRRNNLQSVFPPQSILCYSVKANPNTEILRALNNVGSHFEAASTGEIEILLDLGVSRDKILYSAPGKRKIDLELSMRVGVKAIIVDSSREFFQIIEIANIQKRKQQIFFRLNPGVKSHGKLTMGGNTHFGMVVEDVIECCNYLTQNPDDLVEYVGLHCYQGTNIFDSDKIVEEITIALDTFKIIFNRTASIPQFINLGGGFGSPCYEGEEEIQLSQLQEKLGSVLVEYQDQLNDSILIFESGRYVVAGGGAFVTQVVDIKTTFGKKYAILDGGINCFGGMVRTGGFRFPPIKVLSHSSSEEEEPITLCGPLCTPLDVLAVDIVLPKIDVGDFAVFFNSGAYNFTASPGKFLSFGFPKEITI